MKGERTLMLILTAILAFLVVSIVTFMQARDEIARINKSQIESCYMLECNILPFGKIQCHQVGIQEPDIGGLIKIGVNYTAINDSLWRIE